MELLRIVAMFLIVLGHFGVHGFGVNDTSSWLPNRIIIDAMSLGGKVGVNLFIMISAYFMCDSKINTKKIIKIAVETWFYSMIIFILFSTIISPVNTLSAKDLAKSFFPVTLNSYWFITDYILLMFISPFLNEFIERCTRNTYRKFIIVYIILAVIIAGTIPTAIPSIVSGLGWFIGLYLIIAYIKKYVPLNKSRKNKNLCMAVSAYILLIFSSIILNILGHTLNSDTLLSNTRFFAKSNSVFVFIASIETFIFAIKSKPHFSRVVNIIASTTLGIYLVHDNILMRPYLWQTLFSNQSFYGEWFLPFYAFSSTILIFIVCMIVDLIRQKFIEGPLLSIFYKLYTVVRPAFVNRKMDKIL